MHPGDGESVARDADEAHEAFVARLDRGLERAALAERLLPLAHVDEVVQLDQVDRVDAQPVERAVDLLAGSGAVALAGLRREEEAVAVPREPGGEPQLGVAVGGGGVDVVDAMLEQRFERAVGFRLRDASRAPPRRRSCACSRGRSTRTGRWRSCLDPRRLHDRRVRVSLFLGCPS